MKSIKTREKYYKHWTNYIYVIFPRFINNPPAQKKRDCHDQEIADSKNKKINVIDDVGDLTNIIWGTKASLEILYIMKNIYNRAYSRK